MGDGSTHVLGDVLDRLASADHGESIAVRKAVEPLRPKSFASLMLVVLLISTSPAGAIPSLTATVAAITFILAAQTMVGQTCLWLPGFITRRHLPTATLRKGIGWLRRPVRVVERFLKAQLTFLLRRPWLFLPLVLILAPTLFMPFMEVIPTSGSIASAVIALFAAGLLTRDGALAIVSQILLPGVPVAVWRLGFGA